MPEAERAPGPAGPWYSYAIVRAVPRVERGEFVNVGVILFVRERGFLEARILLDEARVRALAPEADLAELRRHLDALEAVCRGAVDGGPVAALPPSERFHWLTSPRSTVIQTSPVHTGCCDDPEATLEELLDAFVRPPRSA
jgi:hypothetical protein